MSRWLPGDLSNTSLGEIEAEIASIKKIPMRDRTVRNVERLRDLLDAQRRITGGRGKGCDVW